jgi:hypothetical protein
MVDAAAGSALGPYGLAIGAGLSALSTIPNWYQSWKQSERADELAKGLKRPDFEIPKSELESLASAQAQAGMTRLPGQSGIEGQLESTAANEVANVERMGTGGANDINAASRVYSGLQGKQNELGIKASDMWLRNQDVLRSQLDQNAEWQQKKWEWDKQQPYENTAKAISALREGSARNFDTGWKDLFGGASNLALGEYLRGAGGKIGDVAKKGSVNRLDFNPNAGLTAENYGMGNNQPIIDPFQTNPTVSGMNITNDMPFNLTPESMRVKNKPIFDAFNYQP